jgi:23S rRNA (cytidine1920-2'-O)/16S rRNA (cytidine1409-2'-O)-methyltransferase
VAPDEAVEVLGPPPRFVSRGGEKLDAALDRFAVDLAGTRVLDAGASTGGFTDCCLQRGAAAVVAVDVGRGQLHERLRADRRVEVVDRTNVRAVAPGELGDLFDVAVADLSFISLTVVVPTLVALVRPGGDLVVLVKPQFEAGPREASKGRGVIRDPAVWTAALERVIDAFGSAGTTIMGVMTSPLRGAAGNVEFLLHARRPADDARGDTAAPPDIDVAAVIDEAVAAVVA